MVAVFASAKSWQLFRVSMLTGKHDLKFRNSIYHHIPHMQSQFLDVSGCRWSGPCSQWSQPQPKSWKSRWSQSWRPWRWRLPRSKLYRFIARPQHLGLGALGRSLGESKRQGHCDQRIPIKTQRKLYFRCSTRGHAHAHDLDCHDPDCQQPQQPQFSHLFRDVFQKRDAEAKTHRMDIAMMHRPLMTRGSAQSCTTQIKANWIPMDWKNQWKINGKSMEILKRWMHVGKSKLSWFVHFLAIWLWPQVEKMSRPSFQTSWQVLEVKDRPLDVQSTLACLACSGSSRAG